jgi:hypothetical protein
MVLKVISSVLLCQIYVNVPFPPVGTPVSVAGAVLLQIVWAALIILLEIAGFTVMVNIVAGPVHVVTGSVAITLIVATIGDVVTFTAVNEGILPVPLVLKPMSALLVHAKVAPAILLPNVIEDPVDPTHN